MNIDLYLAKISRTRKNRNQIENLSPFELGSKSFKPLYYIIDNRDIFVDEIKTKGKYSKTSDLTKLIRK